MSNFSDPGTSIDTLNLGWGAYFTALKNLAGSGAATCDVIDEIAARTQQLRSVVEGLRIDPGAVEEAATLVADLDSNVAALRSINSIGLEGV